jgi:8-oxo-dGTP pyrophosphatase MutT (NUDIX family)
VLRRLTAHDPDRHHVPPFPDARPAAVLVALADGPHGAEVLLTKRSAHLRNHRGEISFPGGRIDPGETPLQTAVREAWEEVQLPPDLVDVTAQLEPLSTVVSKSYIVPLVAHLTHQPELVPHDAEVERILWVPLAELARPDTFREEWWGTPPLDRPMYFFELDDETVWGATGRMLFELLSLAYEAAAPSPDWW